MNSPEKKIYKTNGRGKQRDLREYLYLRNKKRKACYRKKPCRHQENGKNSENWRVSDKAKRGQNFEKQVAVGSGKCIREIKDAKNFNEAMGFVFRS